MRAHLAAIGCNGQEISRAHLAAIGCNGLNTTSANQGLIPNMQYILNHFSITMVFDVTLQSLTMVSRVITPESRAGACGGMLFNSLCKHHH